jgi:hypothetical protein
MPWYHGKLATIAGGIALVAISLFFYVRVVNQVWDFSTCATVENRPLASDFANHWLAAKLVLSGHAELIYNQDATNNIHNQLFGTRLLCGNGWYYPPFFLFAVVPLGMLPYLQSFFISIIAALVIYLFVLSRINHQPIVLLLCLFFPGTYENFIFGQNGFISGILLGGGLLLLDRYPIIAGCLFGLLGYKPPLVILTFIALVFGRYWKTLTSAVTTIIILALASLAVFGLEVWIEYFKAMSVPMRLMLGNTVPLNVAPTFFAAILSARFGARVAYLVQGVVMAMVLAGVGWVWQKKLAITIKGSVLVLGTLVFTPYSFVYDLAILALPLLWLWEEGRLHGRLPGELILLLLGWLLPFEARIFYLVPLFQGKLQIAPLILMALFFLALAKAKTALDRRAA